MVAESSSSAIYRAGGCVKLKKEAFSQRSIKKKIELCSSLTTTSAEQIEPTDTITVRQRIAHVPKVPSSIVIEQKKAAVRPKPNLESECFAQKQNNDVVGSIIASSTKPPSTSTYKPFILPIPPLNPVRTVYVKMNIAEPQADFQQQYQESCAQQQYQASLDRHQQLQESFMQQQYQASPDRQQQYQESFMQQQYQTLFGQQQQYQETFAQQQYQASFDRPQQYQESFMQQQCQKFFGQQQQYQESFAQQQYQAFPDRQQQYQESFMQQQYQTFFSQQQQYQESFAHQQYQAPPNRQQQYQESFMQQQYQASFGQQQQYQPPRSTVTLSKSKRRRMQRAALRR